jgi:hypothetical protein
VEYDLENSTKDDLRLASTDRIEQSAVPQCMTWYPPITKEHFIVTANDQVRKSFVIFLVLIYSFEPYPSHDHVQLYQTPVLAGQV